MGLLIRDLSWRAAWQRVQLREGVVRAVPCCPRLSPRRPEKLSEALATPHGFLGRLPECPALLTTTKVDRRGASSVCQTQTKFCFQQFYRVPSGQTQFSHRELL